ncbi:hypothetical protein A2W24_03960 [Microgenomates group bacterium RBG_16_45_19]|nr:MAG: hypothetical protein A2W24_03960 [Microgenomates group bacterium RBG_16_45_19]
MPKARKPRRTKSVAKPDSPPLKSPWYKAHQDSILIVCLTFILTVFGVITFYFKPPAGLTPPQPAAANLSQSSPTAVPQPQTLNPAPEPVLTAQAIYLFDPDSGTVLLAKNPHLRLPPASITKIMTAIVALKSYALDEPVLIKDADRSVGQTANLTAGETMSVANLLKAMLINSGNDAAVALAQHHPQGYAYFVDQMNQEALNLGLMNTHFTNVSGIDEPNHYSSAYDLAKLGYMAIQNEMIKDIVQTQLTSVTDTSGLITHPLTNLNQLLTTVPGVLGIKTGWTQTAGECLLTYVKRDGYPLIITLLGSRDRFAETETLIDWAYQNFPLNSNQAGGSGVNVGN